MSRIFISHSAKDGFPTVAIGEWLKEEGWDDVYLDVDPDRGTHAGERWQRALYDHASDCEAVLFLVSVNWLTSEWCRREYDLARKLNKQVFIALIDDTAITDLPTSLRETHQAVSLAVGVDHRVFHVTLPVTHEQGHITFSREGLARLKNGLVRAGLDPRFFAWPPTSEPNRAPYRGFDPLDSVDAGIFFGRDAPIIDVLDMLRGLREGANPRLLVVLGASGAGKSSFLRAGVLPRLSRDDRNFSVLPIIRPERAAISGGNGLIAALAVAAEKRGLGVTRAQVQDAVIQGCEQTRVILRALVNDRIVDGERPPTLVVAVDQAEELFRPEGLAEGEPFLALLRDLVSRDDPAVAVLFSIRTDSYDALERTRSLEGLRQHTYALLPMPRGAYQTVIEGPAKRLAQAGRKFDIDPGLTQALLTEIEQGGGSDALPLLAFTLEQLYHDHAAAGKITKEDLGRAKGLKGAIDAAIKRALIAADKDGRIPRDPDARLALLRRGLIPWLAGVDPENKSVRRRIARAAQIPEEARPLIDLLVEQRLLTRDKDKGTDEATIEPAHEALLRQWGLLKGWLEEDFGRLAVLEGVKRASRDWDANKRNLAWAAHGGTRLDEAEKLDERPDLVALLDSVDRAYLATCRDKEKAAREAAAAKLKAEADKLKAEAARLKAEADSARNAKRIVRVTTIAAVVALCLAIVAGWQWRQARDSARRAYAAAQAESAQREIASQQRDQAVRQQAMAERATRQALARRDQALTTESLILAQHARESLSDGKATQAILLSLRALPAKDERPWVPEAYGSLVEALGAPREKLILYGHKGSVRAGAWSTDGKLIVTGSSDKTVRLWSAETGKEIEAFQAEAPVRNIAVSKNSRRILTIDKAARLLDAATAKQIAVLDPIPVLNNASVSEPERQRLQIEASGYSSNVPPRFMRFNADGHVALTAGVMGVFLWDAETGKSLGYVRSDETGTAVTAAAFSPDGKWLATGYTDGTVSLWDMAAQKEVFTLSANVNGENITSIDPIQNPNMVMSLAIGPGMRRIVAGNSDGSLHLWDLATQKSIPLAAGHSREILDVSFSSDGRFMLSSSIDNTARIWNAATGQMLNVLRGPSFGLSVAKFSPDSTQVITAYSNGELRVSDVATGAQISVAAGHNEGITSLAFSPDDARVLTTSWDDTARVWDFGGARRTVILRGHEDWLNSAVFSPDQTRVLTSSDDGTARIWDAATGRLEVVLRGHLDQVKSAVFGRDGRMVLTASDDNSARLWDAATGKEIGAFVRPPKDEFDMNALKNAAFSPDGKLVATADFRGFIRLWDTQTQKELKSFSIRKRIDEGDWKATDITEVVFSLDGKRLFAGSYDSLGRIFDISSGQVVTVLQGHTAAIESVCHSPDGQEVLTSADDGTARLWDASTGRELSLFRTGSGKFAAFSPDGKRIVTSSYGGGVSVWDKTSRVRLLTISPLYGSIESAVFSSTGDRLLLAEASSSDRNISQESTIDPTTHHTSHTFRSIPNNVARIIWVGADPAGVTDLARSSVPRQLTEAEKNTIFGDVSAAGIALQKDDDKIAPDDLTRMKDKEAPAKAAPVEGVAKNESVMRAALHAPPAPMTDCDRLAGDPVDSLRPSDTPGVAFDKLNASVAISACRRDWDAYPEDARLMYELGRSLDAGGQLEEARQFYERAASSDNVAAIVALGYLYEKGRGVPKNDDEAERYYRLAADRGVAFAIERLGEINEWKGDDEGSKANLAANLYERASLAGNVEAMKRLARMRLEGRGGVKDEDAAAKLFERAANAGDADAMVALGDLNAQGLGVSQDDRKAVALYRQAAAKGLARAFAKLAFMADRGRGSPSDPESALKFYQQAIQAGDAGAMFDLAWKFEHGSGVAKNTEEALRLYEQSAQAGNTDAMYVLGLRLWGEGAETASRPSHSN